MVTEEKKYEMFMTKDDKLVKLYDLSQEDIVRLVFSLLTKRKLK